MRGAVFLGNRKVEMRNFPDPTPGPGEVVIEMKASGMCGSDLKFYRSPPGEAQKSLGLGADAEPFIAGHEPCGVVAARGPGVSEREAPIGQRVMDHHYAGCGVCKHCRVGWSQLCKAGITVYGVTAHGGHARVPEGAGAHAGAAARRALLRRRRRGVLRHRHRLRRAAAHASRRRRDARGVRPGTGRPQRHAARRGDGRARDRGRDERRAARAGEEVRRGTHAARDAEEHIKDLTNGEGVDLAMDRTGVSGRAPGRGAQRRRPGARCASSAKAATSPST